MKEVQKQLNKHIRKDARVDTIDEMISFRRGGSTLAKIASTFDVSVATAQRLLKGIKRNKPIDPRLQPMKAMREDGASIHTIAERFHLSDSTVQKIVQGIKRKWVSDYQLEEMKAVRRAGAPLVQISKDYQITPYVAAGLLKGIEKVPLAERSRKPDPRLAEMRAMRNSGALLQEIGTRFGISRERARQVLDSMPRPKPETKKQRKWFKAHFRKRVNDWLKEAGYQKCCCCKQYLNNVKQKKCPECNRAIARQWHQSEHGRQLAREWQQNNPERCRLAAQKWRENNPEKYRQVVARANARRKLARLQRQSEPQT